MKLTFWFRLVSVLFKHTYVYATPDSIRKYPVVTLLQDLRERVLKREDYETFEFFTNIARSIATAAQNVIL
jgi:hypothetical protein